MLFLNTMGPKVENNTFGPFLLPEAFINDVFFYELKTN